jgi:hypothetical protein
MKQLTHLLAVVAALAIAGCAEKSVSPVEVTRDATLIRNQFETTRIVLKARDGHRIVVMRGDRRTEEIALSRSPSAEGLNEAEIFLIAALTPLPEEKEALLHWTAHIRSGGTEVGGPTEAPRRVTTQNLADVFKITVAEGGHELEETVVSVAVGENRYDFVVK